MLPKFFLILMWIFPAPSQPPGSGESGTSVQAQTLRFVHRERSLQPGEAIVVEAESSRPVRQMTVEAFGREFMIFIEDRKGTGLLGIDLETSPGIYPVKLNAVTSDGESIAAEETLTVTAKEFPTRRLTVRDKYVSPPASVLNRIRRERERVDAIFALKTAEKIWTGHFRLPVPGEVISAFGKRSIYNGQPRSPHSGIDFRGRRGTPVRAPNAGRAALVANLYYSGKTVILDHGLGLYSYFGHLSSFSVKEGDMVRTGDLIGKVGSTGLVTGPHLHWTVRLAGARIDPLSLVEILSKQ